METENKNILTLFLRNLADLIESDNISKSQLQQVGEFYMSYSFKGQVKRDKYCKHTSSKSKKDLQKFIFLGWYVYNKILNNETL